MPMTWVVRDALGQFSVLVARKAQLELSSEMGSSSIIKPTARNSDITSLAPPGVGQPSALSEIDLRLAIKSLQSFLLSVIGGDDMAEVATSLMALAKQYEQIDHNKAPVDAEKGKQVAPSTTDKKETIDDKKDSSVTFLILDTLCILLCSVMGMSTDGSSNEKKIPLFRIDQRVKSTPLELYRMGGGAGGGGGGAASNSASTSYTPSSSSSSSSMGPVVPADVKTASVSNCHTVIPFAFSYLSHLYSSAVRHAAARLLGILSVTFLPAITVLFIGKFALAKKDEAKRAFASYQRAVGFLDFRVNSSLNIKTTLDYLTNLLAEMKNVDRGVLRQEICSSLDSIYCKILSSTGDIRREQEWQQFLKQERGVEDWNVLYERIYATVAKWSTKSKHTLFCFQLLASMVVNCRSLSFFQSKKRMDIQGEILKLIRKESSSGSEMRRELMKNYARNYLNHLPAVFLQAEQQEFQSTIKTLFTFIFPKKTKPSPEDQSPLLELIVSAGRKNLPFFIQEIVIDILKPGAPYYSRQKALLLQAIAVILEESPQAQREMQAFLMQMGPLVCPYIEDSASNPHLYTAEDAAGGGGGEEDKQILLLRAALKCFPFIRHPKMEHVQVTCAAVILLTTNEDREISGLVSRGLQRFLLLDLNQFFLPTIHTLVDLLKFEGNHPAHAHGGAAGAPHHHGGGSIDSRPDQILKICNTISLLCNTLADQMEKEGRVGGGGDSSNDGQSDATSPTSSSSSSSSADPVQSFQVTPGAWLSLREHVEAVVLMRLTHYEGWVRSELLRMLQSVERPAFRVFESIGGDSSAAAAASPRTRASFASGSPQPYLIDYLLPESCGAGPPGSAAAAAFGGVILPTNEMFYRPLHELLIHPTWSEKFRGVINYAFSFLQKHLERIHPFLDQNRSYSSDLIQEEWYLFWRNKCLFCALSVKATSTIGESVEGVGGSASSSSASSSSSSTPSSSSSSSSSSLTAQDFALKFIQSRPRLNSYTARVHEVYHFYENLLSFLHVTPPALQGAISSGQLQMMNANPLINGLYLVKLNISKDLSQIRPGGTLSAAAAPTQLISPSSSNAADSSSSSSSTGSSSSSSSKDGGGVFLSNYIELARHLRRPLTEYEAAQAALLANPEASKKKSSGKKAALELENLKQSYYFNEFIVHIFSRLFSLHPS